MSDVAVVSWTETKIQHGLYAALNGILLATFGYLLAQRHRIPPLARHLHRMCTVGVALSCIRAVDPTCACGVLPWQLVDVLTTNTTLTLLMLANDFASSLLSMTYVCMTDSSRLPCLPKLSELKKFLLAMWFVTFLICNGCSIYTVFNNDMQAEGISFLWLAVYLLIQWTFIMVSSFRVLVYVSNHRQVIFEAERSSSLSKQQMLQQQQKCDSDALRPRGPSLQHAHSSTSSLGAMLNANRHRQVQTATQKLLLLTAGGAVVGLALVGCLCYYGTYWVFIRPQIQCSALYSNSRTSSWQSISLLTWSQTGIFYIVVWYSWTLKCCCCCKQGSHSSGGAVSEEADARDPGLDSLSSSFRNSSKRKEYVPPLPLPKGAGHSAQGGQVQNAPQHHHPNLHHPPHTHRHQPPYHKHHHHKHHQHHPQQQRSSQPVRVQAAAEAKKPNHDDLYNFSVTASVVTAAVVADVLPATARAPSCDQDAASSANSCAHDDLLRGNSLESTGSQDTPGSAEQTQLVLAGDRGLKGEVDEVVATVAVAAAAPGEVHLCQAAAKPAALSIPVPIHSAPGAAGLSGRCVEEGRARHLGFDTYTPGGTLVMSVRDSIPPLPFSQASNVSPQIHSASPFQQPPSQHEVLTIDLSPPSPLAEDEHHT
mmetsp:Transcript_46829/g.92158  ORF Transcript_46829/g.92158 Transcript_46829/m.92158 type:complete len:650 (-) Transcript_46829:47-1996(-)